MSEVRWPRMCVGCGATDNLSEHHETFTKNYTETVGIVKKMHFYSVPALLYVCPTCAARVRKQTLPKLVASCVFVLASTSILVIIPLFTGQWLFVFGGHGTPQFIEWIIYVFIIGAALFSCCHYEGRHGSPGTNFISLHWNVQYLLGATYTVNLKNRQYAYAFQSVNPLISVSVED